jgi:hypothetical protein
MPSVDDENAATNKDLNAEHAENTDNTDNCFG